MNAITACLVAAAAGILAWLLILAAFYRPAGLIALVAALGVGAGWAVIAFLQRRDDEK